MTRSDGTEARHLVQGDRHLLHGDDQERVPGPPNHRTLVLALSFTTFLQWLGASALLPLLPLWVRHNGGSDALAGAVIAAFFVAGLTTQVPAGRLADRVGRRTVLYFGLILYALGSLAFLAPFGPISNVVWRFLQGTGVGASEVAALAIVGAATPVDERGRAFGTVYAGQLAGLAIGPLFGSLLGVEHMRSLFVLAAAMSLLACLPVAYVGRSSRIPREVNDLSRRSEEPPRPAALRKTRRGDDGPSSRRAFGVRWGRALVGAAVAAFAIGLLTGVYEACWTLLLKERGAATWQIGLSWTLFAVPFVAMSVPAGRLADHLDRRWLVVFGLFSSALFAVVYPLLHSVGALIGLGALEAVGVALILPAVQSIMTEFSPLARLGHAQGVFATSQTAATALAAGAGGWLFGIAIWLPFVATAAAAALVTASIPLIWAPVRGRVLGEIPSPVRR
ncbi:MAG TPA: MFS transporter [Acidimicrobiales bacterium]|nr:MFS transporter [Acidimicrobiales bacterium]